MKQTLGTLKALADGNRLRIVAALMENKELCVCYLTQMLGITMASVSRHMSILLAANVVASRKEGRWVYYRLTTDFPAILKHWLKNELADAQRIRQDAQEIHQRLCCDKSKQKSNATSHIKT